MSLFPSRMFKEGDVIFKGQPFAFVLLSQERTNRCDQCFITLKCPHDCFKCQSVFYCSRECQREAEHIHEVECPLLTQRPLSPLTRLMARILSRLREGDIPLEEVCGRPRSWDNLMDHYDNVIHDASAMNAFNNIFTDLESILGSDLDVKSTLSVYGKVLVNSFAIQDEIMRPIGRAVYLGASIFDHSCLPNASFAFIGKTLYIKAIRDIHGEPIRSVRISYLDELDTIQERRKQLSSNYYFDCDCERCSSAQFDSHPVRKELIDLRDDLDTLGLDSLSISFFRNKTRQSSQEERFKEVVEHLTPREMHEESRCLLVKLTNFQQEIMTLTNVVCLKLADICLSLSALDPQSLSLQSMILSMIEKYYGRNHPRAVLQILRVALVTPDVHAKIKLLNRAHSIAQVFLPSLKQQESDCILTKNVKSMYSFVPKERQPTLLTVIEYLLKEVQDSMTCKLSLKNKEYKWKNQMPIKLASHGNMRNSIVSGFSMHPVFAPAVSFTNNNRRGVFSNGIRRRSQKLDRVFSLMRL